MVCALLAGSLWHGPVPWIHSHERLEAQGLPESALAWHVRHLHPDQGEHTVFGWHVHFSYPWDVSNEPSPPPDPKAPRPRAVYDMPYVVGSASSTVDASRLAGPFHGDLVSSLATAWAPLPLLAATASEPEFRRRFCRVCHCAHCSASPAAKTFCRRAARHFCSPLRPAFGNGRSRRLSRSATCVFARAISSPSTQSSRLSRPLPCEFDILCRSSRFCCFSERASPGRNFAAP